MALRTILEFPDPRLRTRARPVTRFDASLGTLIDDMLETMYQAPGIGLAATQVDVHERVIVIDISEERDAPLVLINPEILGREGEAKTEEGCLSVPGIFDEVKRAAKIRVRSHDRDGTVSERDYEDILAVCIQHEMDHLEGKLFVDYLSEMKRERIRKKLDKERKERAAQAPAKSGGARAARTDVARRLCRHAGVRAARARGAVCPPRGRRGAHPAGSAQGPGPQARLRCGQGRQRSTAGCRSLSRRPSRRPPRAPRSRPGHRRSWWWSLTDCCCHLRSCGCRGMAA